MVISNNIIPEFIMQGEERINGEDGDEILTAQETIRDEKFLNRNARNGKFSREVSDDNVRQERLFWFH
jgi:hypothetical protein